MTTMTINDKNRTIEMTKKFAKAASRYGSEEYSQLQAARRDYPDYRAVTKGAHAKKCDNFKGLTYDFMKNYIQKHDGESGSKLAEFEDLRAVSEEAKELGMKSASYQEIKEWFFQQFPEIAKFQEKREKILAGKKSAA